MVPPELTGPTVAVADGVPCTGAVPVAAPALVRPEPAKPVAPAQARRKLSFKEQRELEQLPATIDQLETRVATLTNAMSDPAFFRKDSAAIVAHNTQLADAQAELDRAFARWVELDAG